MKLHSGHIEVAVAKLLGWRTNTIVPNVSWGLGLRHECDMLVLDQRGRFTEIEIKISVADLRADLKKGHGHRSEIISRLVFAMPLDLCEKWDHLVPSGCGIIAVDWAKRNKFIGPDRALKMVTLTVPEAQWYRGSKHKVIKMPSEKQVIKFMNLGCMRIWSLKEVNHRLQREIKELRSLRLVETETKN
jgi:hypothetical protein